MTLDEFRKSAVKLSDSAPDEGVHFFMLLCGDDNTKPTCHINSGAAELASMLVYMMLKNKEFSRLIKEVITFHDAHVGLLKSLKKPQKQAKKTTKTSKK